jgi:hypothetical protein
LLNVKIWLQPVDLIDSRQDVARKPEPNVMQSLAQRFMQGLMQGLMQKNLTRQMIGCVWATSCLTLWATEVYGYQVQQVGDVSVTFHVIPDDRPIANQPSIVGIQIQHGESTIARSECQDCRLSLLAPDGQILNQFDGAELQPLATTEYEGVFGTTMIFGAPGEFLVQLEGTIDQQPINLLFAVPVQLQQN